MVSFSAYLKSNYPLGRDEIRLLLLIGADNKDDPIRASIAVFPIDDAPQYRALSYVWGPSPSTPPAHTIEFHQIAPVPIGENLAAALRDIRSPRGYSTILWVDALCTYVFRRRDSCRRFWRHRPPETAVFSKAHVTSRSIKKTPHLQGCPLILATALQIERQSVYVYLSLGYLPNTVQQRPKARLDKQQPSVFGLLIH
jgi:Heterokaryon incompatibility protein (HET)